MSVQVTETPESKLIDVQVSGKLSRSDYRHFAPEIERLIQSSGKLNILLRMENFHGWNAGALWEDIKFDLKHFSHIRRLAMVGDKSWERWMAVFCRPFTTAKVRYFDRDQTDQARTWVQAE